MSSKSRLHIAYLTREHKLLDAIPSEHFWKLSTYDIRSNRKGRPGRARPCRKNQKLKFNELPQELRQQIFKFVYFDSHRDPFGDVSIRRGSSTFAGYEVPHRDIVLHLPNTFGELCVDTRFLFEALPHYLAGLRIDFDDCTMNDVVPLLDKMPLLKSLMSALLLQARRLEFISGQNHPTLKLDSSLRGHHFPSSMLQTIHIELGDVYWVRVPEDPEVGSTSSTIRRRRCQEKDLMQLLPTQMRELQNHPQTSVVRACLHDWLQTLRAYHKAKSAIERLWPSAAHRKCVSFSVEIYYFKNYIPEYAVQRTIKRILPALK